ncbi:SusC/RagA family TonB-linked outer membrane protein [Pseudobacter ginsenosidimutans]|uniref:TonB-linked SusC/RagA family outer membrane protein n=1 Tax=Pseudobacter ginsenosidimutans TaxID=661488 RepID=A0A4Q7MGC9_9BACT|nr:SusC/RagA family TonB-linked outer membrane protein [Pseudobacter ginsenosidimutans]QEC45200.1 SusC/RagA family TonB-linked outer membrane protein [Pseudobacter ginsenosidimutans]RZS65469.1 TonB-linked SusC/RagA family outer membrane protein [Pseudobacter ginsenosidimutans]
MKKKTLPAFPPGAPRLIYLFLLLFLITAGANAQTVTGKVLDNENKPVDGATITVKGTSKVTSTNASGSFTINAGTNDILVVTYVGFATLEVPVSGRNNIAVSLFKGDGSDLNEVIVTALGVRKASKKLGYSTTSVSPDELVKNRTANLGESLEGRVAGLNITPPAAGAGASNQIRIRGQVGFAGADNSPLLVINGLPIDQGARFAEGRDQPRDRGDNLANINPDDIESMTVLKGAAAAAIYGSRAARGAIIITTKSGQKNQGIGVDFTSSYTTSQALNFMDEIVQTEYGQGQGGNKFTTAAQIQGNGQFGWGAKLDGEPAINYDGVTRPYSAYPHQLFDFLQTGTNLTNTLGLSGGGPNGSFRASISTTNSKGIVPSNEYKRRIFNVGINQTIAEKLKLLLNINYADEDYINPPQIGTQGDGAVNFFNRMPISTPIEAYREHAKDPATGAEWKTSGFQGTVNNPYFALQNGQTYKEDRNRLLGTATLRYDIKDWLYIQGRFNYDRGDNFAEWNTLNGTGANTIIATSTPTITYRGSYNLNHTTTTDINADFLLGTSNQFGKFSVEASFGGNTLRSEWKNIVQTSTNFTVPDLYSYRNGTVKGVNDGFNYSQQRVNSLYGTAEIGYNNLLYISGTGRNDWFSILDPSKNSKFYSSVSGSFVFSELLKNQQWLSYGKLRASWAQVGSVALVNPYDGALIYALGANLFNGQTTASINGTAAPNPYLQPFTVTEKEIGLETRLFKNKLLLDIAVFDKVTTDQIIDVNLSGASGYLTSKQNAASLKNSGLETLVELKAVQKKDFSWTTSWNNAWLKTKVLDAGNPSGTILLLYFNGTGNEFLGEIRYTEGLAMNQLYTKTYKRNDKGEILVSGAGATIGRPLASTTNPPGITPGFQPVGSSIPKFTGGWNNNFTYKNLSVGIHIDYKFGGTVLSSTLLNMTRQGLSKMSLQGRENGYVFPGIDEVTGTANTNVITVANNGLQNFWTDYRNNQIGDPFTFKSDFIKLRNISLAYNFSNLIKKVDVLKFVKGLSLSASCRNVAILYKDLPGLDPEAIQSSGDIRAGYENSSLPTTRNYNLTLNVKF